MWMLLGPFVSSCTICGASMVNTPSSAMVDSNASRFRPSGRSYWEVKCCEDRENSVVSSILADTVRVRSESDCNGSDVWMLGKYWNPILYEQRNYQNSMLDNQRKYLWRFCLKFLYYDYMLLIYTDIDWSSFFLKISSSNVRKKNCPSTLQHWKLYIKNMNM